MKLRTEIKIPTSEKKIDHHQKIYFSGSCFSENIATKFSYFGFDVLVNSHGIIYNPVSIRESFYDLVGRYTYDEDDLIFDSGRYFSYSHHSSYNGKRVQHVIGNINDTIQLHSAFLEDASFVFITIGTAWVYTEENDSIIVANCHKMPASKFEKRLLSKMEIDEALEKMVDRIHAMNPNAHIVFTLSPVKHLKDGFVENQQSKSLLHVAIQECLGENISYFPAYEIMNDDLRDYRFWKEDMIHPNELAINYIWEKFCETYFNSETLKIMDEVKQVRQFSSHRSLSSDKKEIQKLKEDKQKRINELQTKYPQLKNGHKNYIV